jgi:hypothetical protein
MQRGRGKCQLCGSEDWVPAGFREGFPLYLCPSSHEWPGVYQPGQQPPPPSETETLLAAAARRIVDRFEARARELACDRAPTGVEAIQARYYPLGGREAPSNKELAHLRRGIQQILSGP